MKKLKDTAPVFYEEMLTSLNNMGHLDIAAQLPALTINRKTLDKVDHAIYIYTDGVRDLNKIESTTIGVKHKKSIEVKSVCGIVVIDLDNFDRIMGVEILDRTDLEQYFS